MTRPTDRSEVAPPVVAVGGRVATGKSTVARALTERLGAVRIEADAARAEIAGGQSARGLADSFEERVYEDVLGRAQKPLDEGSPVVLDACFPRVHQRDAARALAAERGRPFLFVEVRVPPDVQRARLEARPLHVGRDAHLHEEKGATALRGQGPGCVALVDTRKAGVEHHGRSLVERLLRPAQDVLVDALLERIGEPPR